MCIYCVFNTAVYVYIFGSWPQLTISQVPVPRIDRIVNLLVVLVMLPIFASTFLFPGMDASGAFWIFFGWEREGVTELCKKPSGARGCSSSDSQLWFWCIITLQTVRVRKGADWAYPFLVTRRVTRAETMLDHWQTSIDTWWSHW